jgi:hypothetical protein
MPSSTLKRTAATLGVLAGLLAAAAPASAQLPPTASGVTAVEIPGYTVKASRTNSVSGTEMTAALRSANAPASPTSQVFTAVSNAIGAQIGSEGVKDKGLDVTFEVPEYVQAPSTGSATQLSNVSFDRGGFSRGGHLSYTSLDAKSGKEGLYSKQSVLEMDMEI